MKTTTLLLSVLVLAACAEGTSETEATGRTTFEDAATDDTGAAKEPESPPAQNDGLRVTLEVEGTGTFDVPDPQCLDGLTGAFEALYEGEGSIDNDGVYSANMVEADASFETPSGCTIPQIEIGLVTDIVVRGELQATQENCETYCEAKGRAYAEEECSVALDEAACRAEAEGEYETECTTTCTGTTTYVIVAETSVGASALSNLDVGALSGAALGSVEADLSFERIEDSSGDEVNETPTLRPNR